VVESFYENVQLLVKERRELAAGETEKHIVLEFTPNPPQPMLIACLWSHWTDPNEPDLSGFAAITDEPPPDVASAGHDRCIIPRARGCVVDTGIARSRGTAGDSIGSCGLDIRACDIKGRLGLSPCH
jgi:hypothetical protein